MLVHQGTSRTTRINLHLACSLAGIAGALNAAAFYSVGFFSANMTGNVSTLSDHVATGQWRSGLFYLCIIALFIFGSSVSTLLINAGSRRAMTGVYAYSILLEALLLTVLGMIDLWVQAVWRTPTVVLGLAFLMGLQNATVTRISDARVRTTHVSGMATDIGIEIGMAFDMLRGHATQDATAGNFSRLYLHSATIASFLAGGIVGVLIYQRLGGYLMIMAAFALLALALRGLHWTRKTAPMLQMPNDL